MHDDRLDYSRKTRDPPIQQLLWFFAKTKRTKKTNERWTQFVGQQKKRTVTINKTAIGQDYEEEDKKEEEEKEGMKK